MKRAAITAACLLALAAGCGGGGGGSSSGGPGGDPIDAAGPIEAVTKAGATGIVVGGVSFSLAGAAVTLDDRPGGADDLRVGQYVRVRGFASDDDSAFAESVVFDDEVQGPIASLNLAAGTLVVLGRTIRTNAETVIRESATDAPLTLAQLAPGDIVEVSGPVDAAGVVLATRIERRPAAETELEVKGRIASLNVTARRFSLGGLVVDYSSAIVDGVLANGAFVEARSTEPVVGGVLVAERVQVEEEDDDGGSPGDRIEIEGFVTGKNSPSNFEVDHREVRVSGQTVFVGGTKDDVAVGVRLEVRGRLDGAGKIHADRIVFEDLEDGED